MDPRRLLPALTALACACLVLTLALGWARSRPADPPVERRAPDLGEPVAEPSTGGPADALAAWDRQRARAWADGDVDALRGLYVAGSRAGAADVRLLRLYLSRGLRVEGLTTQVLALRVVDRSADRVLLRVTDRVVGARAVGPGVAPRLLPVGRPAERRVELRRVGGTWRVVEAAAQDSAAASTSRTSSSSKS